MYDRKEIEQILLNKLDEHSNFLKLQYKANVNRIPFFYVDDLFPLDLATNIFDVFPKETQTTLKKSLKEHKYVAAQMDRYDNLLEEVIYAFQQPQIVTKIEKICGLSNLQPDENLYAGGISMMREGNFLNPHLDNSHDKDRNFWRVLNLLYYVTPDWKESYGGNLELWPEGVKNKPTKIHAKFNRLVVMATHANSWHSVEKVTRPGVRCCVSNYYFSATPITKNAKFHVTTFRGRPEQKFRDKLLMVDSFARMQIRKIFKKGIVENPHVYKK
ncbi:2OG-Fe(II) oxygenase [Aquimarina agarivorans]|uniref:2OG-Fe(II) oxygenase n=1 Tax=Aquimarina agarivorans TaxID=980584 RepID=UPI000248E98E|nr:2OG-Fe(II) oxygenase [Aquimarina agarivorans]